jgi:hypothetical protein
MKRIKSNYSHLWEMWKNDVNWYSMNAKGKMTTLWFGISLCGVLILSETFFVLLALISLALSAKSLLEHVEVEE